MHNIIVKQGPLVFLKDVLVMESVAFVLLFMASFIKNYELLYHEWSLNHYLRYDLFILIASSLFQLFYLITLFINWYFLSFEISEKEITKKSGLFFRRQKSVSLADVVAIETYQSFFDRRINHATIIIEHRDGRVTKIRNVAGWDENVKIIKRAVANLTDHQSSPDIQTLLQQGEGANLEFKAALRYDLRKNEVSKEIERAIMKTVVGFLNADGGIILIGVNDDGAVCGLKNDYQSLPKKNRDSFENHLATLLKTMVGLPFAKYMQTYFADIAGEDVCLVKVKSSHKPAYLKNDNKEEFFVRVGNSTQPFSMSDTADYIKTHFG
ncbi:MAG: RNA-binding domain-containing protein [Candidatus Vogelbacteria bacterium]